MVIEKSWPRRLKRLIAKSEYPTANGAIDLLAVRGDTPPARVIVNEFTTVASVCGNVWVMNNNWQDIASCIGKPQEALSTRCGGQGVVILYGMAKPVRTPQIGPARAP
jgi:hypothetical protein